jgi:hypothetical protein
MNKKILPEKQEDFYECHSGNAPRVTAYRGKLLAAMTKNKRNPASGRTVGRLSSAG